MLDRSLHVLSACFVLLIFAGFDHRDAVAGTGWHTDFRAAESLSQQENKPLLVHFHTSWCGPCRRMDGEVLRASTVQSQLQSSFVAVKVDGDAHPELCKRFGVRAYPSDVVISPTGHLLARSEGFRDLRAYTSLLAGVDAEFTRSQKIHIAKSAITPAEPALKDEPSTLASQPAKEKPIPASPSEVATNETILAMEGYCPVTLRVDRKWVKGDAKITEVFKGLQFRFASVQEQKLFHDSPETFSPRLLGCDPVVLSESDKVIAGSVQYGAFYDRELFLFVSDESRRRFKQSPDRYSRTKHVLRPDMFSETVIR